MMLLRFYTNRLVVGCPSVRWAMPGMAIGDLMLALASEAKTPEVLLSPACLFLDHTSQRLRHERRVRAMERDGDAAAVCVAVAAMAAMAALPELKSVSEQRRDNFACRERPYFREVDGHERESHGDGDARTFEHLDVGV